MDEGKCPNGCVNLRVDREKLKKSIEKKQKVTNENELIKK